MNEESRPARRLPKLTGTEHSNGGGATLTLASVSFSVVEFRLERQGKAPRLVRVAVGSGPSWSRAVRFPTPDSEASASTGDEGLDAEVRRRAGEDLVRLEASVRERQA